MALIAEWEHLGEPPVPPDGAVLDTCNDIFAQFVTFTHGLLDWLGLDQPARTAWARIETREASGDELVVLTVCDRTVATVLVRRTEWNWCETSWATYLAPGTVARVQEHLAVQQQHEQVGGRGAVAADSVDDGDPHR